MTGRRRTTAAVLLLTAAGPATRPTTTGVRCDVWAVPDGGAITDTLADAAVPRRPADVSRLPDLALDPAPADGHVVALSAVLTPRATGDYTFAIAADDTALLYLATDPARPEAVRVIASVPAYTPPRTYDSYRAQTSGPVHLTAGRRYPIQAWMQNAYGVSHVSVQWTRPDGRSEPIPGDWLSPPDRPPRPPSFDVGPVTATLTADPDPADRPGFHKRVNGATCAVASRSVDVSYLLRVPPGLAGTTDRRPLVVFLHGNGHQGSDLWGTLNEGPADFLSRDEQLSAGLPAFLLAPQLPEGWRWDHPGAAGMVNAIVRGVCQRYRRIDPRRVELTGLSMGGKGSWLTALDAPELYASVTTFSAVAVRPATAGRRLAGIRHLGLICGADDGEFAAGSAAMYAALRPSLGDRVDLITVPNEGHGVWHRYYGDPAFYRQIMAYSR